MGTSRKLTETQLQRAKQALSGHVSLLQQAGTEKTKYARDPKWRKLDAEVRKVAARLRKIGQVEALNAEVLRLREEKLAAPPAPVEEAPAPKAKKAKKSDEPAGEKKNKKEPKPPKS